MNLDLLNSKINGNKINNGNLINANDLIFKIKSFPLIIEFRNIYIIIIKKKISFLKKLKSLLLKIFINT